MSVEISEKARVLVVDDHPLLREALIQLINRQDDLEACGEASSTSAAGLLVEQLHPVLLLLDLRLGADDTLDFIKSLRARFPKMRILVLSQHDETLFAERSLRAGADGYITKQEASNEVLTAMRTILRGETYVSRKIAALVFRRTLDTRLQARRSTVSTLSDRELHVYQLLGSGFGTRQIAEELNLSVKTIETHRENIKNKLGISTASELVQKAKQWIEDTGENRCL